MPPKARPTTRTVDVFVEIPKGSRAKYEGDDPSVSGWRGSQAAWKAIDAARKRARA